jgi:hypothetical protein
MKQRTWNGIVTPNIVAFRFDNGIGSFGSGGVFIISMMMLLNSSAIAAAC